ncbi:MAG: PucR family transcriptional regulator [Actinomycetota bacterium]
MVTLGEIVRAAGPALRPLLPFDAATEITGVHVSELPDPGRYLDGGELLLTTGIPLTGGEADGDYVTRLSAHGASALGLGLGEGWDDPPAALVDQCRSAGLPLFAVPDGVAFLDVSRAFWEIAGRDRQEDALRTAHAHTRLAQAAAGTDPLPSIVRLMSQAIGGWVAWVPFDGRAPDALLHPPTLQALLPAVSEEVERSLLRSGVTAASFISHGSTVMAHGVSDGDRPIGALALGAGRPWGSSDRQLALTAVSLLRLVIGTSREQETPSRWVTALALDGETTAARVLARSAGIALPDAVRILVDPDGSYRGPSPFVTERGETPVRLLAAGEATSLGRGAISTAGPLELAPAAVGRALALWHAAADRFSAESALRSTLWVEALTAAGPEIRDTVRVYLRHRQQSESAARELGIHRNTVRPRIVTAERALGVSLADPDVAAELWIALRDGT